jgi:Helix-turn-helix domain
LTEILSALADESPVPFSSDEISLQSKIEEVLAVIGVSGDIREADNPGNFVALSEAQSALSSAVPQSSSSQSKLPMESNEIHLKPECEAGLHSSNAQFENAARNRSFQNYWEDIAIKQNTLALAYILEAFKTLGVDFTSFKEGDRVPYISYQPKYSRVVQRLWDVLEKQGIVKRDNATLVRGAQSALCPSSSQLHEEFVNQHARYAIEVRLMALTGCKLAEFLKGDADPIRLLFGTASSGKILEKYYEHSPMLSTLTDQLVTFVMGSIDNLNRREQAPLRALEVGAGSGGTTARLVERLAASGITIEYTFSDVSSTMVSKAKKKFEQSR